MVEPDTSEGERMGDQQSGHPQPDGWLLKHQWIVNKNRSDRKIAMSHPLSSHNNYSEPEALYSAETIQQQIEEVWNNFTPKELPKEDLNGARTMKEKLEEVFQSDDQ